MRKQSSISDNWVLKFLRNYVLQFFFPSTLASWCRKAKISSFTGKWKSCITSTGKFRHSFPYYSHCCFLRSSGYQFRYCPSADGSDTSKCCHRYSWLHIDDWWHLVDSGCVHDYQYSKFQEPVMKTQRSKFHHSNLIIASVSLTCKLKECRDFSQRKILLEILFLPLTTQL